MVKRILIVEDDPHSMKLLRDVLMFWEYTVIEAGNGKEGVKLAKAEKPDLILMDIQMPIMDGFLATRLIKEDTDTSSIPIICVTSHAMREDEERILQAGINAFITKPIDVPELIAIVKKYLKE